MGNSFSGDHFRLTVSPGLDAGELTIEHQGRRQLPVFRKGEGRHVRFGSPYRKVLNENLAPLVRFLRSRLGRRWDDVFSEICTALDTRSTVKTHVRLHLDDIVMRRISVGRRGEWLLDGWVLGVPRRRRWYRRFFVDPRDGILKDACVLPDVLPAANGQGKGGVR